MILGKIIGRVLTNNFKFVVEDNAKKFQYVQILHKEGYYVLAQIVELERDIRETVAYCNIIGYRDQQEILRPLTVPLEPGSEVLRASDDFIKKTLNLEEKENSCYIGTLEGRDNIKVFLDLNKVLTKHISILAKSGSGKSYTSGVIIEEILEKKIPAIIIDPHGEYTSLRYPNDNKKDREQMIRYGIEPHSYNQNILEFSPNTDINPGAIELKLDSSNLEPAELIHLLPAKLSNMQLGILYSALKNLEKVDFDSLLLELENEESSAKWTLINIIEYVKKLNLFSESPTSINTLVQPGKVSIINLKGVSQDVQEVIVYKLLSSLFAERKKGNISPFLLVIEEAHLFIPERSFGESKSSGILRQICAEGRKFGLSVCLITQRPSRIEKNALSQVSTQIVLKMTNPHDIRAVSSSLEGITTETESEIRNIPIGTAMVVGVVDTPLFVNIRPRRTKHGGEAVNIIENIEKPDIVVQSKQYEGKELLPIIKPMVNIKDLKLIYGSSKITANLIPCLLVNLDDVNLLINLNNGHIISNIDEASGKQLTAVNISNLPDDQIKLLRLSINLLKFRASELFSRSGMEFSTFFNALENLTKRGIFVNNNDEFTLNDKLTWLNEIPKLNTYAKIEFANLEYDSKYDKSYDANKIINFFGKFYKVKNFKECWLLKYEATY